MKKEPVEEIIVPSEERGKILNDSTVSKFVTKKMDWNKWLSSSQYSANKNIRFKIRFMWYSGAYIVVKGTITVEVDDDEKKKEIKSCDGVVLENYLDHKSQWPRRVWTANLLYAQ